MRRAAALLVLAGSLLAGPALHVARAADLSPGQKAEMRVLYDKATRAYDVGKYAEAIEEYQKAYEIGGDPPMLYNIAQAYRLNNQPTEAVRFYKRYLQRAPSARNREDVERKIAEQEKIIEEQRKLQPPAPPPTTPSTSPTTTPATPASPSVGPPAPVPVAPAPLTTPENPGASPSTPSVPTEEPSHVRTIVSWSLVGLGVAAGVVAGLEAKVAGDRGDTLTMQSKSGGTIEFDPNIEKEGKNARTAAIVLGAAGGALVVTGIVLLLTGGSSSEVSTEATPVPTARASFAPWIGAGLVGAGADIRF